MDLVHDKVYLDSWLVTQLELFDILFLISFLKSLRNPIISLFVHSFPTFYTNTRIIIIIYEPKNNEKKEKKKEQEFVDLSISISRGH